MSLEPKMKRKEKQLFSFPLCFFLFLFVFFFFFLIFFFFFFPPSSLQHGIGRSREQEAGLRSDNQLISVFGVDVVHLWNDTCVENVNYS